MAKSGRWAVRRKSRRPYTKQSCLCTVGNKDGLNTQRGHLLDTAAAGRVLTQWLDRLLAVFYTREVWARFPVVDSKGFFPARIILYCEHEPELAANSLCNPVGGHTSACS